MPQEEENEERADYALCTLPLDADNNIIPKGRERKRERERERERKKV
jgi:hypothetical protein